MKNNERQLQVDFAKNSIISMVLISIMVVLLLVFVTNPFGVSVMETSSQFLSKLFPIEAVIFSTIIPLAIFLSYKITVEDSKIRYLYRERVYSQKKRIAFFAKYRQHKRDPNKTEWQVKNVNNFTWESGRFFIERLLYGKKDTKVYPLENIQKNSVTTIESDFPINLQARWRVLVVTRDGYAVDLADRWENESFSQK